MLDEIMQEREIKKLRIKNDDRYQVIENEVILNKLARIVWDLPINEGEDEAVYIKTIQKTNPYGEKEKFTAVRKDILKKIGIEVDEKTS